MTKILIPYLPPELLEIILSYLDSSTLQTCLDIAYLKNMAQKELDKRCQCCLKILTKLGIREDYAIGLITEGRLDLSSVSENVTKMDVIILVQNFNKLNMLDLRHCSIITDDIVKIVSRYCSSLDCICLNKCPKITNNAIITIVKNSPKLSVIMFAHCSHITDISVKTIIDKCPNMRLIFWSCCPNITDQSRQLIYDNNIRT